MYPLIDQNLTQEWLSQFNKADGLIAAQLIKSLKLVSSSKAEMGIRNLIEVILKKTTGSIALLPISKNEPGKFGSEARIGHILESLQKQYPKRIFINPSVPEMRLQKIKHMILVDDIIGSGTRIRDYWKTIGTSEKSWLSYKICKL